MSVEERQDEPNRAVMTFRFAVLTVQIAVGLFAFVYTSSWILFSIWLGVMVVFYTIPRKHLCARCESYGRKCRPFYLGLYTAKLYPSQQDTEPPIWAALLEGVCILMTSSLPFVPMILHFGAKGVPLLFAVYLALFLTTFVALFFHACRYCVQHSSDEWKKLCPMNKLGQRYWGRESGN